MDPLAKKLAALREAWLDLPFTGVVDNGVGAWLQPLINAVSELVDPDRTLRETDEAKRRGAIGDLRSRHAHAVAQIDIANKHASIVVQNEASKWKQVCNDCAREALDKYGVVL